MKERWSKGKIVGGWEQEKKEFVRERGVQVGEEEGVEYEKLEESDKKRQEEERRRKIGESSFNKWYREINTRVHEKRMGGGEMEESDKI